MGRKRDVSWAGESSVSGAKDRERGVWGERERGVSGATVSGVREREGCEWSEIGGVSEAVERRVSGAREG